ncbi:L-serine ammonia-lyase, iron-sulfur-dependent, subunit alpha [uncultured Desulfuromusa sp.]|uniref:L-cysteine desulfidase family protein n=1 Tax=uncultured Desulfuromusa sp. TaxID=219183 RepID=UPI002AA7C6F2|nr:L-serine ammonia-lyase, iron-sulfur-dependent, subunit alpha [uncultured Desulfuromusa sp.]
MNLLKIILEQEVYPALGCTEPTAVAYVASIASSKLRRPLERIEISVDPGVYKNGLAVTVPNTNGEKGNLIAGVLGALIRQPERKMQILDGGSAELIERAKELIRAKRGTITCDAEQRGLHIEVVVADDTSVVKAVVTGNHTNLVLLEKDGEVIFSAAPSEDVLNKFDYKKMLKGMRIADLADLAAQLDEDDYAYLLEGVRYNQKMADQGLEIKKVGYYLADLKAKGYLQDDVFSSSKILTASAADGRMDGLNLPVMSSGGSGNQGIVAILVPYNVGLWFKIDERRIVESIALSHLVNSYIKCYTGSLSPICGCSIAAGVGAAVAIVYQQAGKNIDQMTLAVNNLISDLGGMLCDGAKGGCALKVVSSTDSAIRSAYMALNNHGITSIEGFIGRTAEETIQNLSRISDVGMAGVDATMIQIMQEKNK